MRDMFVIDWIFGHHKKESFWGRSQREGQRYADHSLYDNHRSSYGGYNHDDYARRDFDDDLDSGMYDDGF